MTPAENRDQLPGDEMPAPRLPNTSNWTWICCLCSQANHRPSETSSYALCTACSHARCRACAIRWGVRTVEQEWTARAADSVRRYARGELSQQEYYALKRADEEYAHSRGMDTVWGWMERMKREGKWGKARGVGGRELNAVCGTRGRERWSGESRRTAGGSGMIDDGQENGERNRGSLEVCLSVWSDMN